MRSTVRRRLRLSARVSRREAARNLPAFNLGLALVVAGCAGDAGAANATVTGTGADAGDSSMAMMDAGDSSTVTADVAAMPQDAAVPTDGAAPEGFWDTKDIPEAKEVMTFKFLNRTNGKFDDTEVFWSFKSGAISEVHSIADAATYDMPANSAGRMYFYLCKRDDLACANDPTKSKYYDFIEHTIGAAQYNGNTTRVDAFGLKIAMRLHCADGYDVAVGEDYATFLEDRAATFQRFVDEVPAEFRHLAEPPFAPYRIVEPGAGEFGKGGAEAGYYDTFVDQMWANNGLTIAKPGPNGSGLGSFPEISAAIYRHVGEKVGTFSPAGKLLDKTLWSSSASFYAAAPANYYAKFWHTHALRGLAYGFPYDDVGGNSTYISHANPKYLLIAIGW